MPHLSNADQSAKVSATEARRRKDVALAGIREAELAEKMGSLVPLEHVKLHGARAIQATRDRLLALPSKVAPRLAGMTEEHAIAPYLRTELTQLLEEQVDEFRRFSLV